MEMDGQHRLHARSQRFYPSYSDARAMFHSNPFVDTPVAEEDMQLDAFDRELLAERTDNGRQHASHNFARPAIGVRDYESMSYDDNGQHTHLSSSSSSPFIYDDSSPTLAAQRYKPMPKQVHQMGGPGQSRTSTQRMSARPERTQSTQRWKVSSAPLSHIPPTIQGIRLVETSRLPDDLRMIFKYPIFNAVQSRCFPHAYETDSNMIVSAPTGSGKTAVMELAICRLLAKHKNEDFKVVYQAPTKSLCNERYKDWSTRFRGINLACAELTGDTEYAHLKSVQTASVIITTPEKWDSVTRKWKDNAKLMRMIKLFLVDEVHILRESRGATLEAVVSRMKSIDAGVRFIALSATVPNSDDIGEWLGLDVNVPHKPAIQEVFGEEFRPVMLEKHVIGYQNSANDFAFDAMLNKQVPGVISKYSKKKPVMIFCCTRNAAAKTAGMLAKLYSTSSPQSRLWKGPQNKLRVKDHALNDMLAAGVAYHHSGLDSSDRQTVEDAFVHGDVNVVCCTSTLAVGVNLPCYLVILKGTAAYTDNGLQEYTSLEVMQMFGRAGRPQYETSGCAVVLTSQSKVSKYESMLSGQEILESCLHENLLEHLNAEIGTGTIHDMASARKWLSSTFLCVRMRKNPAFYQIAGQEMVLNEQVLLRNICEKDIHLLKDANLIKDTKDGFCSTQVGDAMARYYVRFETIKVFATLAPRAKTSEILAALSRADEFRELRWRAGEKSLYRQINKSNDMRYPVKVDIALIAHKVTIAIQAYLSGIVPEKDFAAKHHGQLRQDTLMIVSHCNRLVRCVIDLQLFLGDATAAKNALEIATSLSAGCWDNTAMQLKQIDGVGEVTARKLASAGISSIDDLLHTEPQRIELVVGKSQPFGASLLRKLTSFPSLRVGVKEVGAAHRKQTGGVEMRIQCDLAFLNDKAPAFWQGKAVFVCFLCETSSGDLVDFRRFGSSRLQSGENILLTVTLDRPAVHLRCHIMCDGIAGTHRYAELKVDVPSAWYFGKDKPTVHSVNRVQTGNVGPNEECDEFDDAGVADDDLLAAEILPDDTDEVKGDIDTLLIARDTVCKSEQSKHKRKASSELVHFRTPDKLENGNWTCQHTCNDAGRSCNHKCCREGVKHPKKRPKLADGQCEIGSDPNRRGAQQNRTGTTSVDNASSDQKSTLHVPAGAGKLTENVIRDRVPPIAAFGDDDIYDLTEDEFELSQIMAAFSEAVPENLDNDKKEVEIQDGEPGQPNKFAYDPVIKQLKYDPMLTTQSFVDEDLSSLSELFHADTAVTPPTNTGWPVEKTPQDESIRHELIDADSTKLSSIQSTENVVGSSVDSLLPLVACEAATMADSGARGLEESRENMCPSKSEVGAGEAVENTETESQRKQRLYEEDQKRRWARLDPWLYEEFGKYIDLI